ncbi:MAG: DUF1353 domain-containing protein [Desulfobacterales bacterium]|nr:DUF1353 domain-containing protein [Desulfobacterales bacterium]MCP4163597.1 DUF1353 domain-containing protein [Deltaproteobacteria bacterium]
MKYKKRRKYKYTLHSDFQYPTKIKVITPKDLGFLQIDSNGYLLIKSGYSWDGPSGPAFDTINFMQGSLVHDALYQLIREGVIEQSQRKKADNILKEICRKDGMSKMRVWWVYYGVRFGGKKAVKPDMLTAPL